MSNPLDFQRFSNAISGIVDRKFKALSMSITDARSYLSSLITQSQGYASEALTHANDARNSATEADTAAAQSLIAFNQFTSTYLGLNTTDPLLSSQGNTVNIGAFSIRQADGRLRYVSGFDLTNNPIYADATVSADPSSIASAGANVFLSLTSLNNQTVKGPVSFLNQVIGQRVTNWTSQQFVTATDVNDKITTTQTSVSTETQRAILAETQLANTKANKSGDVFSGSVTVSATGDNAAFILTNPSTNGRSYKLVSDNNGSFRVADASTGNDRFTINKDGNISIAGSVGVIGTASAGILAVNRTDNTDANLYLQANAINRWSVGRSVSTNRFFIARYNAQGVFQDTPLIISETDGSLILSKTSINDTLSVKSQVTIAGTGATLTLNNSSGSGDTLTTFSNLNIPRWTMGRAANGTGFYINRYNDSGAFVENVFNISETTGWVTVSNFQSRGAIQASSVAASILYAQANGTGRSLLIGDDAWLGDSNIANGFSIRGQNDFNAGYISFGNSGKLLGCNAGDPRLLYDGNVVYHSGNSSAFIRIIDENLSPNNGYTIYSNGKKECWGTVYVPAGAALSISLTTPHTSWFNVVLGLATKNDGGSNANIGLISKNGISSFTIRNWENVGLTIDWQTKGV